jgi:FkbM family methyltransferase
MLAFKLLFKTLFQLLGSPAYRQWLWLAFRYGNRPRYQKTAVRLGKYQIEVPDCLSFIWQYKEIFAEEAYRFASDAQSPVILDCGANIGLSCLYFAQLYPKARIIAFEADPTIASVLKKNLRTFGLDSLQVVNKAVWSHEDEIDFASEGADGGSSFTSGPKTTIAATRLLNWLEQESQVDLLKMDIEGAEVTVLKDCQDSLHRVRHLFVEYHSFLDRPQELEALLDILSRAGFRYFLRAEQDRKSPLLNHYYKHSQVMDLQVNIFAYNLLHTSQP